MGLSHWACHAPGTSWPRPCGAGRSPGPSPRHDAAIDHELAAGDVAGGVGGEVEDAVGNVLGQPSTAERDCQAGPLVRVYRGIAPLATRAGADLAPDRRVDDAGVHGIDADVGACHLE